MTAMGIVSTLDKVKHSLAGILLRTQRTTIQEFALQGCEESPAELVVIAVSDRSHGTAYAGLPATFPEGDRGVLAALVGAVDDPGRRRCWIAIPRASRTSSVGRWEA